eukprot:gene368-672_t
MSEIIDCSHGAKCYFRFAIGDVVTRFVKNLLGMAMQSMKLMETATAARAGYMMTANDLDPETIHELVFVIKPKNMDTLSTYLEDISNPASPRYGQHLTSEQVREMTSNVEGANNVKKFLAENGATIVKESADGNSVTVRAPIRVWDSALSTKFSIYQSVKRSEETVVRTNQYFLPSDISEHVSMVSNTVQFPMNLRGSPVITKLGSA